MPTHWRRHHHPAGRVTQSTEPRNSLKRGNRFLWFQFSLVFKDITVRGFECLAKCKGRENRTSSVCIGENSLVKASRGWLSCCVGTRTARCKEPRGEKGAGPGPRMLPTHTPLPCSSPQKLLSRSSGKVGWLAGLYLDDPQCRGLGGDTPLPPIPGSGDDLCFSGDDRPPRPGCA